MCVRCHPEVENKNGKLDPACSLPSVYVGETARSLYERGMEHQKAYRDKKEDSHMYKHHVVHHGGQGETKFHLRPIKFHRTALNRQLSEAVRIGRLGEGTVLNSKSEYNRCMIARLTLEEENTPTEKEMEGKSQMEEQLKEWEDKRVKGWKAVITKTSSCKRKEDDLTDSYNQGRSSKRRKYDLVGAG